MDSRRVVARLYPETMGVRRSQALLRRLRRLLRLPRFRRLRRGILRHPLKISVGLTLLAALFIGHMYYYNRLIILEYNTEAAWAQVEVEEQRRFQIQQTVVTMLIAYSQHERSLMTDLVKLRNRPQLRGSAAGEAGAEAGSAEAGGAEAGGAESGAERGVDQPGVDSSRPPLMEPKAAPSPARVDPASAVQSLRSLSQDELNRLFPQIMMTAEQYPNLRLSENFQQFTTAVIETETRIASRIEAYNDAVNMYTTALKRFPGKLFALVWGFQTKPFYEPAREAITFRPSRWDKDRDLRVAPRP